MNTDIKFSLNWLRTLIIGFTCLVFILQFNSCSSLGEMLKSSFEKPKVDVVGAKIEHLSFEDIGLGFDLKITNPNPVGVTLTGYDYDFLLSQKSFVSGNQDEQLQIGAEGESVVRVPVTLNFKNIYNIVSGMKDKDEADYEIKLGVAFDLPVLGAQRLPVSKSGTLPLLKIPKVSVGSLKLNSLNVSGADLTLNLNIENPNKISFALNQISYKFDVSGKQWLSGESDKQVALESKQENTLAFPISLNFFEIGRSVFTLLTSDAPLDYKIAGNFKLASELPVMKEVELPFSQTGEIKIQK